MHNVKNGQVKKHQESKKDNSSSPKKFLSIHLGELIAVLLGIVGYLMIYFFFVINGPIPTGDSLGKADWLAFCGSYLAFIGTIIVCVVTLRQNRVFQEQENQRRKVERHEAIKPIFSVEIKYKDGMIPGTAVAFNPNNPRINIQRNVQFKIENVGAFPVTNVIIFDKYVKSCFKPNESLQMIIAYEDSPDIVREEVTGILKSKYAEQDGYPTWFNICYNDADGADMFQTFSFSTFEGTPYYSMTDEEYC